MGIFSKRDRGSGGRPAVKAPEYSGPGSAVKGEAVLMGETVVPIVFSPDELPRRWDQMGALIAQKRGNPAEAEAMTEQLLRITPLALSDVLPSYILEYFDQEPPWPQLDAFREGAEVTSPYTLAHFEYEICKISSLLVTMP